MLFLDVVLRFDERGGLLLVDFDYIDIVVGVVGMVVLQRYWSIEQQEEQREEHQIMKWMVPEQQELIQIIHHLPLLLLELPELWNQRDHHPMVQELFCTAVIVNNKELRLIRNKGRHHQ